MIRRCYYSKHPGYENYGGRGIQVCEEWKNSYAAFRKWAYDNGYEENAEYLECTIDRIDVDGDYCPDDCRWADMKTQSNNRRNNLLIEYDGRVRTLTEWAEEFNMNFFTLWSRLYEYDWPPEKAFNTPCKEYRAKHKKEKTV